MDKQRFIKTYGQAHGLKFQTDLRSVVAHELATERLRCAVHERKRLTEAIRKLADGDDEEIARLSVLL